MAKSGLVIGLCGHYWYRFLDTRFPGKARATILKKLVCEMAIGKSKVFSLFPHKAVASNAVASLR